jgi:hypothetical protein
MIILALQIVERLFANFILNYINYIRPLRHARTHARYLCSVNDTPDAKYHKDIQSNDLLEGEDKYIDDDEQIRKE